jgi:hypothetical protein
MGVSRQSDDTVFCGDSRLNRSKKYDKAQKYRNSQRVRAAALKPQFFGF